jgi:hypothetical protein
MSPVLLSDGRAEHGMSAMSRYSVHPLNHISVMLPLSMGVDVNDLLSDSFREGPYG